jgi:hypothetical protein
MKKTLLWIMILLSAGWLFACAENGNTTDGDIPADGDTPTDGDTPEDGDTPIDGDLPEFTSAATGDQGGYDNADGDAPSADGDSADEGEDPEREIVESDLFRVLGNHVYALNQFRGLAIVDFSNPANLKIVGRLGLRGYPKEMFADNGVATILLTNIYERDSENGRYRSISEVVTVDISDPTNPTVIETFQMNGTIADDRQVGDIVYVVSTVQPWWYYCDSQTNDEATMEIISINIADPQNIYQADSVSFPGMGWAVCVTQQAMYVAESGDYYWNDWGENSEGSAVHYIDISDAAGDMTERGTFHTQGMVLDRFKMHQNGNTFVATSVSNQWNGDTILETFDITNPDAVVRLASLDIMQDEQLQATRYSGDRAYIVTFLQTDPLFVVSFEDPANPAILGTLEIPGWSTHLEIRGTKLYGVGVDNEDGWRTKVSLFDATDPSNPIELAKVSIGTEDGYSWSEALYDWKAFKIYDDKGFMLVPTSGWDGNWYAYVNKLNLIDFTDNTLTVRGSVASETPIKRGFLAGDYLASLSETQLQLVDYSDRDNLEIVSDITLASFVNNLKRCGEALCTTDNGWWTANTKLRLFDAENPGDTPYWESAILNQNPGYYYGYTDILQNSTGSHVYLTSNTYDYWMEDAAYESMDTTNERKVYGFDLSDAENPVYLGEGVLPNETNDYYYYDNDPMLLNNNVLVNRGNWTWDNNYQSGHFDISFVDLADLENVTTLATLTGFSPLFTWEPSVKDGNAIWTTDCKPVEGSDSNLPVLKCYAVKLDASDKEDIKEATRFNTPGQAIAFNNDHTRLLSMDRQFGPEKNGYLSCDLSLRVLAMNGDQPVKYLGEIPLTQQEYCYWLNNNYEDGDIYPEDGDVPEPADGDEYSEDGDVYFEDGDAYYEDGDAYYEDGDATGEGKPEEGALKTANGAAFTETYKHYAGYQIMGDKIYVFNQETTYSDSGDYSECGGSYSYKFTMFVKVYSLSDLSLVDEMTLDDVNAMSPVEGGGVMLVGYSWYDWTTKNTLKYMDTTGKIIDVPTPDNAEGYYWYYSYYGNSVRIGDKLHVPNGWYGINTYDLAD